MRRLIVAGALGVAGVLASGVPAHAASADHASPRIQRAACWQKVSGRASIKKTSKKWRDVKAQVYVADPKLCKGKIIAIRLYKRTAKTGWYPVQRKAVKVKVVTGFKYYSTDNAYSLPCGQYVHTEYRLDGVTRVGKSYKLCSNN
ncbi:hypothetical protein NE236_07625 [Actinoallomurus purpureus]|uniref:hypothetical protein n=1 Tax=Actinoallomurus purpureus TaxID=478114 RepID=UPI002092BAAE|nr:hypothetical protein [Actinoallomurus purpureus]MCO6004846.1 hypothetical protein [Actinoallomurus purpureus]